MCSQSVWFFFRVVIMNNNKMYVRRAKVDISKNTENDYETQLSAFLLYNFFLNIKNWQLEVQSYLCKIQKFVQRAVTKLVQLPARMH